MLSFLGVLNLLKWKELDFSIWFSWGLGSLFFTLWETVFDFFVLNGLLS